MTAGWGQRRRGRVVWAAAVVALSLPFGTPVRASTQLDVGGTSTTLRHRIAYQSDRYPPDVHVIDPDGSDRRNITNTRRVSEAAPAWSPDGLRLAYQRDGDLYVRVLATGSVTRLTNSKRCDWDPAWSPDGRQIVFAAGSRNSCDADLFVMNADGSGVRRLVRHPADDRAPAWSPSGNRIIFASNRVDPDAGMYHVWSVRPDGSGAKRLIRRRSEQPAWSPDGRFIAFASSVRADAEIYVARADGSHVRRLTDNSVDDWSPAWSPLGTRILFSSVRHNTRTWTADLYTMRRDGTRVTRLTKTPKIAEVNAAWRPVPDAGVVPASHRAP